MPPPGGWERAAPASGDPEGRGRLILQGAARGWMIFAIVWGSVVLVGESAVQRAFTNSNNNNPGIVGNTGNTGNFGGTGNTGTTP
jgi:hypothetical protein